MHTQRYQSVIEGKTFVLEMGQPKGLLVVLILSVTPIEIGVIRLPEQEEANKNVFLPTVRSSQSSRRQTAHRGHRVKNVYQNLIQVQTLQGKLCRPEGDTAFQTSQDFSFFWKMQIFVGSLLVPKKIQ
ncbi:unnamed protein product [Ixodes pacificus]